MSHLIDTDVVIYHLNGVAAATQLLREIIPGRPAVSAITHMEVLEGIPRSPNPEEAEQRFKAFSERVPILVVDRAVAEQCAYLRRHLRSQDRRLRPRALDLLIAATAIQHGLTLITNNPDDYSDIDTLRFVSADISP
ncbi:hypothetical protein BH23CHL2_BH23CHL2_23470 [soil metagenome]